MLSKQMRKFTLQVAVLTKVLTADDFAMLLTIHQVFVTQIANFNVFPVIFDVDTR